MANIIEIVVTGRNVAKPAFDEAARQGRAIGQETGDEFSRGFEEKVKQGVPPAVDEPLKDLPGKGKESGQQTGNAFAGGMSPLLIGAFAAAATIGPAAILAGTAVAVTGVAALIAGSNKQVAYDYANLGQQVKATLTGAVSPITGDIDAAVMVLEQGVTQVGPQLDKLFATVGPDATQLASGLTQFAQGALPGITQGLASMAPQMHAIAADIGKLGQGIGGFIGGLGVGASGGTTAFNALAKSLSEILPELGQVVGYLSNGLGPALADVLPLVNGAAKGIELLTSVLNPTEIQAAALAFGALFGAFKVSSMAGLLADGTKFTSFLSGAAKTAPEAEGAIKSLATKGVGALSGALDLATGPLGMILAGVALLGPQLGNLAGVGDHTAGNVDKLTSALSDAANGSASAQKSVTDFAGAVQFMANTGGATDGIKSLDQAFTQLYQTNPAQAAKEFDLLSKSLQGQGESAADVAKEFPTYTKTVADAQLQSHLLGSQTNQLTTGLLAQATAAQTSASNTAQQTLAVLGATDGNDKLTVALDDTITAYETASGKASAYKTALDAVYGKYQDYSQAQATFTTDVDNAASSLTHGTDAINLNSKAGAANFTLLSGLATQNSNVAEALLKQTGNQQAANKSLQDGAAKIDALAKSAGFTAGQIAQLNTDLYGTASIKDISVTVGANVAPAYKGVDELLNFVNGSGATIHVYATSDGTVHNSGMSAYAKATGGPIGAAAFGGAHGSWTRLNEDGIEALNLPFGTQVIPAANVNAMAGGKFGASGGGSMRVQFELVGSSDPVLSDLWLALRKHIKLRGGGGPDSVQKALGQPF